MCSDFKNSAEPTNFTPSGRQTGRRATRQIQNSALGNSARFRDNEYDREPSYEDDEGPGDYEEEEDLDIEKLQTGLNETGQVFAMLKEIEAEYADSKGALNEMDMKQIVTDGHIKTVRQCYKIIKQHLYDERPNFDKEKMEQKLTTLQQDVSSSMVLLGKIKGEYFAVNDLVINKDASAFKLEHLVKAKKKQDAVLEKFTSVGEMIEENSEMFNQTKKRYVQFEKALFEGEITETKQTIADCEQLIEKIENQIKKMESDCDQAQEDINRSTPYTSDQIKVLGKIQSTLAYVQKVIDTASEHITKELKNKKIYTTGHHACQEIVRNLTVLELVPMVTQSRQIEELVDNHREWKALYRRLKLLQEEEINKANLDLQKGLQDSKKYMDNLKNGRKDEHDDLIKKI